MLRTSTLHCEKVVRRECHLPEGLYFLQTLGVMKSLKKGKSRFSATCSVTAIAQGVRVGAGSITLHGRHGQGAVHVPEPAPQTSKIDCKCATLWLFSVIGWEFVPKSGHLMESRLGSVAGNIRVWPSV